MCYEGFECQLLYLPRFYPPSRVSIYKPLSNFCERKQKSLLLLHYIFVQISFCARLCYSAYNSYLWYCNFWQIVAMLKKVTDYLTKFCKWLNGENILKTWRKCSNCTRIWKPIWLTTNRNQSQIMAWKGSCVSASQDQLEKR